MGASRKLFKSTTRITPYQTVRYYDWKKGRDGALAGLPFLLHLSRGRSTLTRETDEHYRHKAFEILYFFKGRQDFTLDHKIISCRAGDGLLVYPNQERAPHRGLEPLRDVAWIAVIPQSYTAGKRLRLGPWSGFSKPFAEQFESALLKQPTTPIQKISLGPLFDSIHGELHQGALGFEERVRQLTATLFIEWARALTEPSRAQNSSDGDMAARLTQWVGPRLDEDWNLPRLAALFALKPSRFVDRFRQASGFTPMAFVNSMRIEAAKDLMARGSSLSQVAHEVGFKSQQNFSMAFKRLVGRGPKYFRGHQNKP